MISDRPVGQISGSLRAASWGAAMIGRTMVTNLVTSPDFIAYEFEMCVADNFYFDGYLPAAHQGPTA